MAKDPETAEDFIRMALDATPKSDLRRALLMSALLMEDPDFLTNVTGGPPRKKGRPKAPDPKIQLINAKAYESMYKHYAETGEERAQTLARVAVDSGKVPLGYSDYRSVVERLALMWRDLAKKSGLPPTPAEVERAMAWLIDGKHGFDLVQEWKHSGDEGDEQAIWKLLRRKIDHDRTDYRFFAERLAGLWGNEVKESGPPPSIKDLERAVRWVAPLHDELWDDYQEEDDKTAEEKLVKLVRQEIHRDREPPAKDPNLK
jgi:hypothetical protein